MFSIAVILTTYNRPDALATVLEGYLAQSDHAFELIIADDGSTEETRELIISYQQRAPFKIVHVWHEDRGFRAAAIRNRALEQTTADYVIFSDGDCIPLPHFVAGHRRLAEKGWFLVGSRVLLSEGFTDRVLREHLPIHTFSRWQWLTARLRGEINRLLPLLPFPLAPPLRKLAARRWEGAMTCNLSAWRADLMRINGFDESYQGWGLEDSDLTIRLLRAGIGRKSARFAATVLHLWHRQNPRTSLEENRRRLQALLNATPSSSSFINYRATPEKILVIVLRRLGDVLLTTPLIRSVHRAWPEAQVDALVFEGTEGVLTANPDVHEVLKVPKGGSWRQQSSFFHSLWRRYDLALTVQPGDRPTFYAWWAGRYRIGMVEDAFKYSWWKRLLLNWGIPFDDRDTHTVMMNLALARLLGITPIYEVVVSWRKEDEERVIRNMPFDLQSEPYVIFHSYPKLIRKRWHEEGWVTLGRWLEERGVRVVLTGGAEREEVDYVSSIAQQLSAAIMTAGRFQVAEAAFLLSKAKLFVGVDTALTHMAAALGIPTVTFFGPTNPVKWGPWPKGYTGSNPYVRKGSQQVGNVILLQGEGDCVPCEKGCGGSRNNPSVCLQQLPVATVIEVVKRLLISPGFPSTEEGLVGVNYVLG